ncbi:MAG TPA: hypothetical protein PLJ78_03405 [Anaerolineae bacterium]|nr:hypothetical protein [Anaerolineae bacterium]HQK12975.1 hypothetical protein [Anaerolineae bacterium]
METQMRESVSMRLGRFFGLLGGIAAITGVVVVTQRLSRDALALLVGLTCGVAAMVPTIGLALFVWRREEHRQPAGRTQPAVTPPVIVVSPSLPGYGVQATLPGNAQPQVAWHWQPAPNERTFTIVGGEE